jgi:TATA-box binding protein (TBP) (component of TFIID and TFIIIB)
MTELTELSELGIDARSQTKFKLSTITATGCIGCQLSLESFYNNIVIDAIYDKTIKKNGYTYIEYGKKGTPTKCKGFHKKMVMHHKSKREGKRFDKQITVILRKYDDQSDIYLYQNLKIFINGNIQMTGLKSVDQGIWVLNYVIETVKKIKDIDESIYTNQDVFGINALKAHDYKVRLINSDFKLGYDVNRRILDSLIGNYGLYHSFEAGHYPGVKISFFWNSQKEYQDGICKCEKNCINVPPKLITPDMCKKVTVIVFQSGSVIITGAQSYKQVEDTYNVIMSIFDELQPEIKKKKNTHQVEEVKKYIKFNYNNLDIKRRVVIPTGYVKDG